nr:phosphatase IMPL1, chloroplastic (IMPL1) [Polytomella parva]|mmetsp:Transcript_28930/g.53158  ORF Transcript_28930/g.53158 Transcript_28930/m.53158 type:complete len:294 (-) Transcript_28930:250-1131(-)|eukprot:CAMPEP_0175064084 /NCGR_PEP_ID=MMETSP0052_2-20121109/15126_1 /TAXON_ID=51329 ORGANISM="Polytomella parva, Strain SAG 63-3" /NCGR_SAMPLE_ID=MMETSP0052_2 /ASSEMBLY_ACC=CAM_ASM_000194 /LENGTH=293 /DNA_ID=CAMNT_0016330375 /DNA_START=16 /DNA_END=897 /DNA_ORIENTATION=-
MSQFFPEELSQSKYGKEAKVAFNAALEAGKVIAKAFSHGPAVIEEKLGFADLVTETDKQSEKIIYLALKESFPDHKFIGEEESSEKGFTSELTNSPTWMVDPLDGTTNFIHGFPFCCTSIALVCEKVPVVGVVYNSALDELFVAVRDCGAFFNGVRIESTRRAKELSQALLITELGVSKDEETVDAILDRIKNLTMCMRSVRCIGSCALNLCSVALGRADAFYEIGFGGCWDCAAGALIVTEAGGAVADPIGTPFNVMGRRVLAASPELLPKIAEILKNSKASSKEPPSLESF